MTLSYESANKISSDLSHSDISCSIIDSMDNGRNDEILIHMIYAL